MNDWKISAHNTFFLTKIYKYLKSSTNKGLLYKALNKGHSYRRFNELRLHPAYNISYKSQGDINMLINIFYRFQC